MLSPSALGKYSKFLKYLSVFCTIWETWDKLAWNDNVLNLEFTVVSWHCRWNIYFGNSTSSHITEYGNERNIWKCVPHLQHVTCFQKSVLKNERTSPPTISRSPLCSLHHFFSFPSCSMLIDLEISQWKTIPRPFSFAYISKLFSTCPNDTLCLTTNFQFFFQSPSRSLTQLNSMQDRRMINTKHVRWLEILQKCLQKGRVSFFDDCHFNNKEFIFSLKIEMRVRWSTEDRCYSELETTKFNFNAWLTSFDKIIVIKIIHVPL